MLLRSRWKCAASTYVFVSAGERSAMMSFEEDWVSIVFEVWVDVRTAIFGDGRGLKSKCVCVRTVWICFNGLTVDGVLEYGWPMPAYFV